MPTSHKPNSRNTLELYGMCFEHYLSEFGDKNRKAEVNPKATKRFR
jgi:hypothetical protein